MRRFELDSSQSNPHFIGCWMLEAQPLCEELIKFFESSQTSHVQGLTAGGLQLESKNSTDLVIRPRDLDRSDHKPVRDYIETLFACYADYLEQWPFLKSVLPNMEVSSFNIQRYLPGGHFMKLHTERTNIGTAHRVLAWMTYLNDVEQGGETQFEHQNLNVKPQAGKTLIWPAEWTHAHRGALVSAGSKYIVTGWLHLPV